MFLNIIYGLQVPLQLEMLQAGEFAFLFRFVKQALGSGYYWILPFLWMIHHFHSSLDCRGAKYSVTLERFKEENSH